MTKFKDVAHLYLGCEVAATGKKPGTKHYRLVGATVDGGCLFKTIPEGFSIDLASDWLPLLRPLDSMTEEEEYDLEMLGHQLIIKKVCSNVFHAERTKYLLSKHFDLFSLIPNGEAIDKTKI